MRLAFWQGEFPGTITAALDNLETMVREAKHERVDAIVFPELYCGGGYILNDDATRRVLNDEDVDRLQSIASSYKMAIVVGYYERQPRRRQQQQQETDDDEVDDDIVVADDDDGALYNSAMAIDCNGRIVSNYRKSHLFGTVEKKMFSPGNVPCEPFGMAGVRVAMCICYDVEFPETARLAALGGAQLLIVPTANMHPYDKVNDVIIPARAIENHMFVCYCNWGQFVSAEGIRFNGKSSVCGPTGDVLAKFDNHETGIKIVDIHIKDHPDEDEYLKDRRPELYRGIH